MKFAYRGRVITAATKKQAIRKIVAARKKRFTEDEIRYSDVECPFCHKQNLDCDDTTDIDGDGCDELYMSCPSCGKKWKTIRQFEDIDESCPECGSTDTSACEHSAVGGDGTETITFECNDCGYDFDRERELIPCDIEYDG